MAHTVLVLKAGVTLLIPMTNLVLKQRVNGSPCVTLTNPLLNPGQHLGGFQLLDLIITELKSQMAC